MRQRPLPHRLGGQQARPRDRVPEVGEIVLHWDTYPLPGSPGPVMLVFTAEPGGVDADRLDLLASLHATRSVATRTHPSSAPQV
ncbi:hypothetical protein ACGIF2_10840 [Cellulomonas sp. P22]|uniref:MmyB family transcriptional regulator n=1 Tax=Cellulomonas sp. P22 TaxID=3373189 RepID=UPI003793E217